VKKNHPNNSVGIACDLRIIADRTVLLKSRKGRPKIAQRFIAVKNRPEFSSPAGAKEAINTRHLSFAER
jgi:hypothetical protein